MKLAEMTADEFRFAFLHFARRKVGRTAVRDEAAGGVCL